MAACGNRSFGCSLSVRTGKNRHFIYEALYCVLAIEQHCDFITADVVALYFMHYNFAEFTRRCESRPQWKRD
jgi:hypothetical protein